MQLIATLPTILNGRLNSMDFPRGKFAFLGKVQITIFDF